MKLYYEEWKVLILSRDEASLFDSERRFTVCGFGALIFNENFFPTPSYWVLSKTYYVSTKFDIFSVNDHANDNNYNIYNI